MGYSITQSSTAQPLLFYLIDSSDHISGLTGKSGTVTVKISKNGGSGGSPAGAISEVDSSNFPGLYQVAGNATDTNTLGPLALHASVTGSDPYDDVFHVVAYNPQDATYLGLSGFGFAPAAGGTVNAVTSNSDFTLTSSDLSTNDNDYNNMWLVFTTGGNKFVPRVIGTYTGSGKRVQFTGTNMKGAFPETVSPGDQWQILAGST